ncbi:MAG: protein-glutamine gamma-glutamyltransferase [Bacillota bacterium]|nr:protein-glutamine gamma-glutamyltransferase [Bacillota bacterium]
MIEIGSNSISFETLTNQMDLNGDKKTIAYILASSDYVYRYASEDYLKFELDLRKSIINAAISLNRSRFSFRVFRKSRCNPDYWSRTNEGGFLLQNNVKPSDAINDIYTNSSSYATECSTAMVIVYYKALVDVLPKELFNSLFPEIYLMNWQHLDRDIGIVDYPNVHDYLPGDGRYFKNPDVDPMTPEWQGENVFDLGDGYYYGHGIGIGSGETIISELNKYRIENAERSAYLLDSAKRPNFKHLADKYLSFI